MPTLKKVTCSILAILLVLSMFNFSSRNKIESVKASPIPTSDISYLEPYGLVDMISLGNDASELAHELVTENSQAVIGAGGEEARVSLPKATPDYNGGDITFTMKVDPDKQNYFTVKLWGSDASLYRAFLAIDNEVFYPAPLVIAKLSAEPPIENRFYYSTVPIPLEKSKGKTELALTIRTTVSPYPYSAGTFTRAYTTKMVQPSNKYYAGYVHTTASLAEKVITSTGEHEGYVPPVRDNGTKGSDLDPNSQAAQEMQDKMFNDVKTVIAGIVDRNVATSEFTTATYSHNVNGHGGGTMLPPYSQNDMNLYNLQYFSDALQDNGSERYDEMLKSYGIDQLLDIMRNAMDRNIVHYLNLPGTVQMGGHQSAWGGFYQGLGLALWNVSELFETGRYKQLGGSVYKDFSSWFNGNELIDWKNTYSTVANFYYPAAEGKSYPFLLEKDASDVGENSSITTRGSAYEEVLWLNYGYARTHQYTLTPITNQIMFMQYGAWKSNAGLIAIDSSYAENYNSAMRHLYRASGVLPYYDIDMIDGSIEAELTSTGAYPGGLVLENIDAFNDETQFDEERTYVGGNRKAFGENYYMVTSEGLTRETNYVAGYGEHSDFLVHAWRWVRHAGERYEGTPGDKGADENELLRKALLTSNARAHMKYADTDTQGYRAFRLEATIEARGPFYPYDAGYHVKMNHNGTGSGGSLNPFIFSYLKAEIEKNPNKYEQYFGNEFTKYYGYAEDAVGYAQQMLTDNQLSPFINKSFAPDLATLAGYEYVLQHEFVPTLLPSTNLNWYSAEEKTLLEKAGFDEEELYSNSFYDIEDSIVYFRDEDTVYMMMLQYKSEAGLNGVSRVHAVSSEFDRIAMIDHEVLYAPSNYWNFGTGWTGTGYDSVVDPVTVLPDGSTNMQEGEIYPIAAWNGYNDLIKISGPKSGSPFGGYGEFYSLQYAQYMIAMNTTRESYHNAKDYQVVLPSSYTRSTIYDKMSNSWLTVRNGKVTVSPYTSVALDLGSDSIVNDMPVAPIFAHAIASNGSTSLTWTHSAGTNGKYEIVRATSSDGKYAHIAFVDNNTTNYIDRTVQNGKTYYYKVRGVNDAGYAGSYSPYTTVTVSDHPLNSDWSYDITAWNLGAVINSKQTLAISQQEDQITFSGSKLSGDNAMFAYTTNQAALESEQIVDGNFEMVAEIVSGEDIGIMFKESLNVRSRGGYLTLDTEGNYEFVYRQQPNLVRVDDMRPDFYDVYNNLNPVEVTGTVAGAKWIKVTREGQYVYAYVSVDGENWIGIGEIGYPLYLEVDPTSGEPYFWGDNWHQMKELGKFHIPMLDTIYVGIASSGAGEVDHVQVSSTPYDNAIPEKVEPSISSDSVNKLITLSWKHMKKADHYLLFKTQDEEIINNNPIEDVTGWQQVGGQLRDIVYIDRDYPTGSSGKVYYRMVAVNVEGKASAPSNVLIGEIVNDGIEFPASVWKSQDVLTPSKGHDLMSGSTLQVFSDGLRFWNTNGNSFRFVYQEIAAKSEGTFITRVDKSQITGEHLGEALLVRNDSSASINKESRFRAARMNISKGIFASYQYAGRSGRYNEFAGDNQDAWLRLDTHANSEKIDLWYAPVNGNETDYPAVNEWVHITEFNDQLANFAPLGDGENGNWFVGLGLATGGVKGSTKYYNVAPIFNLPKVTMNDEQVADSKHITAAVNTEIQLTLSAKDAFGIDDLPVSDIEVNGQLPQDASFDSQTGIFSWTPTTTGSHNISFKVQDKASLNDFYGGLDIRIDVVDNTLIPVIDDIGERQYYAETAISLPIVAKVKNTASNADPNEQIPAVPISYSIASVSNNTGQSLNATELGMGIDANTGLFTWTPTKIDTGIYTITIAASTDSYSASKSMIIKILGAPIYTVGGVYQNAIYNQQEVTIKAEDSTIIPLQWNDPTGERYYYFIEQLPEGLTYNGTSIVWKPTFAQASELGESYSFKIIGYNDKYRNELTIRFKVVIPEESAPIYVQYWEKTAFSADSVTKLKSTIGGVANQEISLNNDSHAVTGGYNQSTGRSSFVYQKLETDAVITARITQFNPLSKWAGLLISDYNGPNPAETGINKLANHVLLGLSATEYTGVQAGRYITDSVLAFARNDNNTNGDFPNKGFATGEKDITSTYWLRLNYIINADGSATITPAYKVENRDSSWITDPSWTYSYTAEAVTKGIYGGVFASPANNEVNFDNVSIKLDTIPLAASLDKPVTVHAQFAHQYDEVVYEYELMKDSQAYTDASINNGGLFHWIPTEVGQYELTVKAIATNSGQYAKQSYTIDVIHLDKTILEQYINNLPTLFADDYTIASWNAFNVALNQAKVVLASSTSNQMQINDALLQLTNNFEKLVANNVLLVTKDSYVNSGNVTQTNGSASSLVILKSASAQRLGVMTFDLTQFVGKESSSAKLKLYSSNNTAGRLGTMVVAPIELGNWNEATFNYSTFANTLGMTSFDQLGTRIASLSNQVKVNSTNVSGQYHWEFDIESIVNSYLSDNKMELTLLVFVDQAINSEVNLSTKEATNAALKPTLTIEVAISNAEISTLLTTIAFYNEKDYTASSWSHLASSVQTANDVIVDGEATQQQKNDIYIQLKQAITTLISLKELIALVQTVEGLQAEDYTTSSYAEVMAQAIAAHEVIANPTATKAEIAQATNQIKETLSQLVDAKQLKQLVAEVQQLSTNGHSFTEGSWAYTISILEEAMELLANDQATKLQIDSLYVRLNDAVLGLYSNITLHELIVHIIELQLEKVDFTASSYNDLQLALELASEMLSDGTYSHQAVLDMFNKVTAAHKKLVSINELRTIYQAAELIQNDEGLYTTLTWNTFKDSRESVLELMNQAQDAANVISKSKVSYHLNYLIAAQIALLTYYDANVLIEAIIEVDSIEDETSYTIYSWNQLQGAYAQAISLRNRALEADELLTQSELDAGVVVIQEAIDSLVSVLALREAITIGTELLEKDTVYTNHSRLLLEASIAVADGILLNAEAIEVVEVTEAIAQIEQSSSQLVVLDGLIVLLGIIPQYVEAKYTTSSFKELQEAYHTSLALEEIASTTNEEVTEDEIAAAILAMQVAIAGLKLKTVIVPDPTPEPVVTKTALNQLITELDTLNASDYTTDTWNKLVEQLIIAKQLQANANASQQEIDAIVISLQQVKGELVTVPPNPSDPGLPNITIPNLKDIEGHWAEEAIIKLVNMGVITGFKDSTFRPNQQITRAEFVAIIVKALKLESDQATQFVDTENHWAQDYISIAAALGIVNGKQNSKFDPNAAITRQEMAVIFARILDKEAGSTSTFKDQDIIAPWAINAVVTMLEAGLMNGYEDGTFRPTATATRAEAVTVIVRLLVATVSN